MQEIKDSHFYSIPQTREVFLAYNKKRNKKWVKNEDNGYIVCSLLTINRMIEDGRIPKGQLMNTPSGVLIKGSWIKKQMK